MFTRPIHVAILDDDPSCRTALTRFLKAQGMVVDTYATGGQFFDALALERQDCLLLDFEMPAMSGVDVLKHLGRLKIRIPTIILSAHDDVGAITLANQCTETSILFQLHSAAAFSACVGSFKTCGRPNASRVRTVFGAAKV